MKSVAGESIRATEDTLLQWCNSRLRAQAVITAETDLLEGGYLDSLFVMDVVAHIEKHFGVAIDSAEISPRNFRSIRALAELVVGNARG
jgi:acyl carrier protein